MPTSLLGNIIFGLLVGWGTDAGQSAFGWVLNALGGGDASSIDYSALQSTLTQMEKEITALQTEALDIVNLLEESITQQQFDTLQDAVNESESDIYSNFNIFCGLAPGDTQNTSTVTDWAQNHALSSLSTLNLYTQGIASWTPGQSSLLALAAELMVAKFNTSPGRGDIQPGGTLDGYINSLEQFFTCLVGLQVKALTLYVNWVLSVAGTPPNVPNQHEATQAINNLLTNLPLQCQAYLAAVETLVVGCTVDLTLLDVLALPAASTSQTTSNPLIRAGMLIDSLLSNTLPQPPPNLPVPPVTTFYVRLWAGSGVPLQDNSPFLAFSTFGLTDAGTTLTSVTAALSNYYPDGYTSTSPAPAAGSYPPGTYTPVLVDANGTMQPTAVVTTLFPASSGCQWYMLRASFSGPFLGSYQVLLQNGPYSATNPPQLLNPLGAPAPDGQPASQAVINAQVVPSAPTQYGDPTATFSLWNAANQTTATFVGVTSLDTMLGTNENISFAGNITGLDSWGANLTFGSGAYNVGTSDFSVATWFFIPDVTQLSSDSFMALLCSACNYNGVNNFSSPSDGFWLGLQPPQQPIQAGASAVACTLEFQLMIQSSTSDPDDWTFYQVDTSSTVTIESQQWYHLAAVLQNRTSSDGGVSIYLNGKLQPTTPSSANTTTQGANITNSGSLSLGGQLVINQTITGTGNGLINNALGTPQNTIPCYLNEVAIWQQALSLDDVQALALQSQPANYIAQNLLGYWPLTSGTLNDESGVSPVANLSQMTGTLAPYTPPITAYPLSPVSS